MFFDNLLFMATHCVIGYSSSLRVVKINEGLLVQQGFEYWLDYYKKYSIHQTIHKIMAAFIISMLTSVVKLDMFDTQEVVTMGNDTIMEVIQ